MIRPFFLLALCLFLSTGHTRAQSISDLLTQLVLDTQKLSELKGILQDMYTGYTILDKGYTAIKNSSEGNFNLHKVFLDGLLAISPAVQQDGRIVDILDAEYHLLSEYKAASVRLHANGHFTAAELNDIDHTYSALFRRSLTGIEELTLVITAGQLRMSDAQRLRAIDRVYADITGQLSFLRQFDNDADIQAVQREKEAGEIPILQAMYGLTH